ncbi:outer membrane lipoprotein carrier protein LolA [Chryseolinea sp. T2]|uniref:LolA family protein n=1 Tax=Chryseolinea sp. T2 TaxID=3129255 RepID=UPI00307817A1
MFRGERSLRMTLLVMALIAGSGIIAVAQPKGYTAVKNIDAFRKSFSAESAKIQTIESGFKQEKVLSALTETIESRGQFWFKRTNKVRIEYKVPFSYTMVLNGDKMTVRDGEKQTQVNTRSNKLFQQVNRIMIDCVQGTILDSKDFTYRVFENGDNYLLELTPTSKALREFFHLIYLTIRKADYVASSIEMNEPGGDKTTIHFIDRKLNNPVADAVFTL